MARTTVYLSDEQRRALARASTVSGRSKAELIREGIAIVTSKHAMSEPTLPLFRRAESQLTKYFR